MEVLGVVRLPVEVCGVDEWGLRWYFDGDGVVAGVVSVVFCFGGLVVVGRRVGGIGGRFEVSTEGRLNILQIEALAGHHHHRGLARWLPAS